MRIRINGATRELSEGAMVASCLEALGLRPEVVAVELIRELVARERRATTPLADRAERGHVELDRCALALALDGGKVVTTSCSYNVGPELLVKSLASASRLCGRPAFLDALHGAAPDHPALLSLPESAYLKCAFLRVG